MSININSSEDAQGALPAKTEKRPPLRLKTYNEEGKSTILSGELTIELLRQYFVLMPIQSFYFPIKDDGLIDFSSPHSQEMMLVKLHDLGIKNSNHAKNILKAGRIREISPLTLIYEGLKSTKWDGVDRVLKVVKDLNLEEDFGENLMLLRRYFHNAYALALYLIDPDITWPPEPRVVLILHSNQRQWGKTSILGHLFMEGALKKLIPQLQTEVYTLLRGEIPSDDREMNAYLMNSLAINIDDIQNLLNSRDANHRAKLRSLTTQKEVSARKMYVEGTRNQIRRASLMGSTNNKNVLRDKDENRYMVFSLKGKICFDTVNQENFTQQFWAQIREEAILQKRNCNFTTDVTDIIISRNKKYLYRTDLEEFISDNFEYDLNAKEFSIGELKQHLEKEHICPSFTDNTLRKAIEMIIPADGQYNNRDNKGRWLCIKKKGDSNDRFSGVGNPLPF